MPIKLFARLRMRRGLFANLPQPLLGSEFGHALDQQRLFIGNDTPANGAPVIGNTEILTEHSPITDIIDYTYESNTIETPQTGLTPTTPTVRTLQQVLDDHVSVKAFPVLGDDSNDDSAGFNLAMTQLFCNGGSLPPGGAAVESFRRILFMPAGRYRMIANEIIFPSRAHIVGEGSDSTLLILDSTSTHHHLFRTADSLGQTGTNIGTNGAELPTNIIIENMGILTESFLSLGRLERVSNIKFKNCLFMMGENAGGSPITPLTPSITGTHAFASTATAVGETVPSSISINGTAVTVDYSETATANVTAGNLILSFASTTGILPGMIVSNATHPTTILSGTTVVSTTPTTVTISAFTQGAGVIIGDTINFSATLATVVTCINNAAIPNIAASALLVSGSYYIHIANSTNTSLTINNTSTAGLLTSLGLTSGQTVNPIFMFDVDKLGSNTITMGNFIFENCEFTNYYDVFNTANCSGLNGVTIENGFFHDAVNAPSFTNNAVDVKLINYSYNNLTGISLPNFSNSSVTTGNVHNFAQFVQPSISLPANQTNATFLSLPLSTVGNGIFINYTITQSGTAVRIGKIVVSTDGTIAHLGDDYHESAATNVTFDVTLSGGFINLIYTSSTAVSLMRYSVEFWGNT